MKHFLLFISIVFIVQVGYSQITVTNASFPVVGDTLKLLVTENTSSSLNMGNVGGPHVWDFSFLNSGTRLNEIYVNPAAGSEFATFPDANLLTVDDAGQELYIKVSSSKMEALGFGGTNPFLPTQLAVRYAERPLIRVAPITFISTNNSTGKFNIDIGTNIIPDSLLAGLPIKPDSIRIQFSNVTKGLVDSYGSLKLQNKTYEVLRVKSESISKTNLFIKIFGTWIDPVPLLGGNIPGGFGDFLGEDTTYIYNFYTNTKKEVLVSAEYDVENNFQSVTFADVGGIISSSEDISLDQHMVIYPNPASDFIRLDTKDWKEGAYMLTITDITGKIVYFENVYLDNHVIKEIKTSGLISGQYIFTARDQYNHHVRSVRLVIR
ncbi:MAG: T9SS type A sorting domain-containing protein [Saprospiraceae bacterium]|nr:T9SS type A sorting domain-containing protein [Saprospiraceae bacterium]